jgi:thioredoxin reductase
MITMYKPAKPVKNIIVGAGPAGIQLAYFFEKAGIDYVILERNKLAGSFFDRYPLTGQLISINKRHTGSDDPEFNLRHDWNSLLSEDGPKFTDHSTNFYPDREELVSYINAFAKKYAMKIKYEHTVEKIRKTEGGYVLNVADSKNKWIYRCERLIVATGLGLPSKAGIIDKTKRPIKHYAEFERDFFKNPANLKAFENKSLAIIGNGNSAYELGNVLTPVCSSVNIIGKRYKPMAMSTHYAGDLRSIYLPFVDTFILKSLNAMDHIPNIQGAGLTISQEKEDSPYILSTTCNICPSDHKYLGDEFRGFDHVILCTGWTFDTSIFELDLELTPNRKYPAITPRYESVNNPNLFFIGALMHSRDYKKSSGGFIHGFRYLIEYFFHIHYDGKLKITKFRKDKLNTLVSHILYRINYSSALYQMFGQVVDAFILNTKQEDITYIENVSYSFLESKTANDNLIYFTIGLEYSNEPPETDTIKLLRRESGIGKESKSRLIHPVLRVYKDMPSYTRGLLDEIHFDEDLFANFTDVFRYKEKLTRALNAFV